MLPGDGLNSINIESPEVSKHMKSSSGGKSPEFDTGQNIKIKNDFMLARTIEEIDENGNSDSGSVKNIFF